MPGFVTGERYTDRNDHQSNASGETRTTPKGTFVAAAIYHGRTLAVTETNEYTHNERVHAKVQQLGCRFIGPARRSKICQYDIQGGGVLSILLRPDQSSSRATVYSRYPFSRVVYPPYLYVYSINN